MSLPKPVRVGQPTRTNGCSCCRVLTSHGCSNTITKNGNKIWYVLHNLVEMMPDRPTEEDCANMRTTIHTILQSMPCIQCKLHSLNWFNERISHNNSGHVILDQRDKWIYELWHHHHAVTKMVILINPHANKGLSWPEYRKQLEINRITCNIIHD